MDTNQDNEMQKLVQEQQAPYNPLGNNITARGFESIMAGADPNNPVISFGSGANPSVDYTNAAKAQPATAKVDKQGFITTQAEQESLLQNEDKLKEDAINLYNSMAPDMAKDYSQNAKLLQALNITSEAIIQAGSSFGSQALNIAHSVSAQKHNLAEAAWKGYISAIPDTDPDKLSAMEAIQGYYDAAIPDMDRDIRYAKLSELIDANGKPLSKEALKIVEEYQDLMSARKDNERNMQIEQLYEQGAGDDDNPVNSFIRKYTSTDLLGVERRKGDKYSLIGQGAQLLGDVGGSVAFSFVTGQGVRGLTSAGSAAVRAFAPKAAQMALGASAAAGYTSIFSQSFLAQYNRIRTQALLAGKDIDTANAAGFYAGVVEGGLEFAGFKGFNRLMARDGFLRNIIYRDVLPETLQEGSQTIGENIVTEAFGVTDKQFGDIMTEVAMSMLGGALGGGFFAKGIRGGAERAAGWLTGISAREAAALDGISAEARTEGYKRAAKRVEADLAEAAKDAKTISDVKLDTKTATKQEVKTEQAEQKAQQPAAQEQTTAQEQSTQPEAAAQQPATAATTEQTQTEVATEQATEQTEQKPADHMEVYRQQVQKAEEVYYTEIKDLYRVYTEKAKTLSPNATKQQMENGWRAVSSIINAQYNGGIVAEQYDRVIDTALKHIDKTNAAIKKNTAALNKALQAKGVNKELAAELSSQDWTKRHAAQWEVAEQQLMEDLTDAGISEQEASLSVRFIKGLLYNTTYVNPTISVSDVLDAMNLQIFNTQVLHLRGRDADIPEVFSPAVSEIRRRRTGTAMDRRQEAEEIVGLMKDSKKNDAQIRQRLCGASDAGPKAVRLQQNFAYLQDSEQKVLSNSEFAVKQDYSLDDYMAMAVMRERGASQSEINEAYGIGVAEGVTLSPEQIREKRLKQLYRLPTAKQLKQLQYLGEEIESKKNLAGAYSSDKNIAVVSDPRTGTAFHEVGHFALTKILAEGVTLEKLGLLPNGSPLKNLYDSLRKTMELNGELPTERQFQETLLDQANKFILNGKGSTPELTAALAAVNNLNNANTERVNGSLLHNRSDRANLSQGQKANVAKDVENIFSNNSLADLVGKADALASIANFDVAIDFSDAKAAAERVANQALELLDNSAISNKDMFKAALEAAYEANDVLMVHSIAMDIANTAKNQALTQLVDSISQNERAQNKNFTPGQTSDEDVFYWSWGKGSTSKRPVSASKLPARAAKTIKQYYDAYKTKDTITEVKNAAYGLIQSIDSAAQAVSPELGSLINKEMYKAVSRTLKARETIGVITNAIEENGKKYKPGDEKYLTQLEYWQIHTFLGNGTINCFSIVRDVLERKCGKKAAEAWDWCVKELPIVKKELIAKGLNPKLFGVENYFPMVVEDYDGLNKVYFGNPNKRSAITKLVDRAYKEATTSKDGKPIEMTEEQARKLKADIIDNITGRYQRNTDDANKVSSLLKRQVFEYNIDMMKYYKDPFDTLADYFESAYRTSMMRTLIGKIQYDADGNPIYSARQNPVDVNEGTNLVGQYLFEYQNNNKLNDEQVEALNRFDKAMAALAKRNKDLDPNIFNTIRQLNSLTMLGSPINAINQFGDLYLVATAYGFSNMVDGIFKAIRGQGINVRDVNVQSSNEVYRPANEGAINKATKWVYKHTFFEQIDVMVKNATLNAAASWFQETLSQPGTTEYKMAMHYLDMCYPPSSYMQISPEIGEAGIQQAKTQREGVREQVIKNLKAGNLNDPDVKFMLWYMLSKTQPQTALSVPANYNAMGPLGKLCYQFTPVSTRQLEFLADYYKTQWQIAPKPELALKIGKMLLFMLAIGVPKEALADILRGRQPDFGRIAAFTPLQPLMINEYLVATIEKEGLFSGLTELAGPSFGALDNVSKDLIRAVQLKSYKGHTFKSVPIFGTFAYNWMFGGADYTKKMKNGLFEDANSLDESAKEAYAYLRSF